MIGLKLILFAAVVVGSVYSVLQDANLGIIGGHKIRIERVPFMASLLLNGTHLWCGASIIHQQFILTAAHCIIPNRVFKVKVGSGYADSGGTLYDVEKIIIHEQYSNRTLSYDVCLMKLTKPITFGTKVAPIALADQSLKLRKGTMVNITGWGSTGHNSYSHHLRQVTIPTITRRQCQMYYLSNKLQITSQMICAGQTGKDSCQGDSGGPLTYYTDIGNVQVGITSFGIRCGEIPGVYVRVSTVLPWILDTVSKNLD